MLDATLVSIAEERASQDIEDRREAFSKEVAQLQSEMSARGLLRSGACGQETVKAIGNELRVRSSLIWHAFARAIGAKPMVLSQATGSEIKERISTLLEKYSPDLPEHYRKLENLLPGFSPQKSISELKQAALDRIFTEIDYAVLKPSEPSKSSPGMINIIQGESIIQTGDDSSVQFNIRPGQLEDENNIAENETQPNEEAGKVDQAPQLKKSYIGRKLQSITNHPVYIIGGIVVALLSSAAAISYFVYDFPAPSIEDTTKQNVDTVNESPALLSPQAEKLLFLIHKYQIESASTKLNISYDGKIYFEEREKNMRYKFNLIQDLFDISSSDESPEDSPHWKRFESLLLDIPSQYVRVIPTNLVGCPYSILVTEEGIKYLKDSPAGTSGGRL